MRTKQGNSSDGIVGTPDSRLRCRGAAMPFVAGTLARCATAASNEIMLASITGVVLPERKWAEIS